jgi:hypothetical protein
MLITIPVYLMMKYGCLETTLVYGKGTWVLIWRIHEWSGYAFALDLREASEQENENQES